MLYNFSVQPVFFFFILFFIYIKVWATKKPRKSRKYFFFLDKTEKTNKTKKVKMYTTHYYEPKQAHKTQGKFLY